MATLLKSARLSNQLGIEKPTMLHARNMKEDSVHIEGLFTFIPQNLDYDILGLTFRL